MEIIISCFLEVFFIVVGIPLMVALLMLMVNLLYSFSGIVFRVILKCKANSIKRKGTVRLNRYI